MLVAVGTKDAISGSAHELAGLLPAGRALDILGRDHMLAVGAKVFKEGVRRFLGECHEAAQAGVTPASTKFPRQREKISRQPTA